VQATATRKFDLFLATAKINSSQFSILLRRQLQVSPATPIPNFRSRILPRILRPQRLTPAGKLLDLLWVFEAELPWKGRSAVLLQE
jgi:hypothetical protein